MWIDGLTPGITPADQSGVVLLGRLTVAPCCGKAKIDSNGSDLLHGGRCAAQMEYVEIEGKAQTRRGGSKWFSAFRGCDKGGKESDTCV